MENFAQRVRQLRKESGKTQMKMADYFGVTTDYLLGRSDQRS